MDISLTFYSVIFIALLLQYHKIDVDIQLLMKQCIKPPGGDKTHSHYSVLIW